MALATGVLIAGLIWPAPARAHSGAPYPVLVEAPAGPYIVSVWADPDIGGGTFIVATTVMGGAVPAETSVTLRVRPEDNHTAEASYPATRQRLLLRGERFVADRVPLDTEGPWVVQVEVEGPAGRGTAGFTVTATPPGPSWLTSLLCLLPFVAVGVLWLVGVRRHSQVS